jgi:hypothetical protein
MCENMTFIGYLSEICTMCKNMAIWCLAWFYFWHVCSFWILVFSFWWTLYWTCQLFNFWWRKMEAHIIGPCFISQEKGDVRYGGASCISGKGRCTLWGCVYLLTNSTKKTVNRIFSMGCSLCQHTMCPLAHIRACMFVNGHLRAWRKKHRMEHNLFEIFEVLKTVVCLKAAEHEF